jgi:hypothetical protein
MKAGPCRLHTVGLQLFADHFVPGSGHSRLAAQSSSAKFHTSRPEAACAPPPLPQKLPIAPIFIADSVSLAVSREKDRKLRIVYAWWDEAKVVQSDGYG